MEAESTNRAQVLGGYRARAAKVEVPVAPLLAVRATRAGEAEALVPAAEAGAVVALAGAEASVVPPRTQQGWVGATRAAPQPRGVTD